MALLPPVTVSASKSRSWSGMENSRLMMSTKPLRDVARMVDMMLRGTVYSYTHARTHANHIQTHAHTHVQTWPQVSSTKESGVWMVKPASWP